MADVALSAKAITTAPEGYTIPGSQEIILKSVTANYDGTGAGGSFIPTLQIVAPSGAIVASCPIGQTLPAGATADVSWFPRGGVSGGPGGSGIQFDTQPQAGQFLYVQTDGPAATNPGGDGIQFVDTSGNGIEFDSNAGGGFAVSAGPTTVIANNGGFSVGSSGAHTHNLVTNSGSSGSIFSDSGAGGLKVLTTGSSGQLEIIDQGSGGIAMVAEGSAGITVSSENGPVAFPATTGVPIVIAARSSGAAEPEVLIGVDTADWITLFDRNGGGVALERFRFFGNGQCQMLTLPTSSVGLPSGSLWNNLGIVSIVP